ncbi:uncharacterized protein SPPG_08790 [Spizellomyces punctatus DAOM BR117]|uniref:Uncharacterized protein n=1 Tax=Spizellomyces punctatus (strain DAOM BR117) TaxID=645134 RepID=A0A0L0H2W9_SPIPD|nr:uncharacterized protein SPPG_08790 [Spizellomyces punctatus DAOM BR117]KNC95795.1 hypothetical protein SPPG_08790 [Spizellomyces punctatus DAOM BR117]|eukprot:XP_016603835.1 hypothetical protein SPPG_08790 [Spizellomyces punctatus DAOM BR117]
MTLTKAQKQRRVDRFFRRRPQRWTVSSFATDVGKEYPQPNRAWMGALTKILGDDSRKDAERARASTLLERHDAIQKELLITLCRRSRQTPVNIQNRNVINGNRFNNSGDTAISQATTNVAQERHTPPPNSPIPETAPALIAAIPETVDPDAAGAAEVEFPAPPPIAPAPDAPAAPPVAAVPVTTVAFASAVASAVGAAAASAVFAFFL